MSHVTHEHTHTTHVQSHITHELTLTHIQLVPRVLALIWAGRRGLLESEIRGILAMEAREHVPQERLLIMLQMMQLRLVTTCGLVCVGVWLGVGVGVLFWVWVWVVGVGVCVGVRVCLSLSFDSAVDHATRLIHFSSMST